MRGRRIVVALVAAGCATVALTGCTKYGASLARPADPVVVSGSSLPKLTGTAVQHIVGFSWDGSQWHQIPIQVDQRELRNPGQILHRPTSAYAKLSGTNTPFQILTYVDPATASPGYSWWPTYTGPATHVGLGSDDEVSFLADEPGRLAPLGTVLPAGVTASTQELVATTDPLTNGTGAVYLFAGPTLTGGGAGTTGVKYTFSLDSGNYLSTYKMGAASLAPNAAAGTNPEHTTIVTPAYTQHYGDRWLNDGLTISVGGAPGTNILERSRVQFPNTCGRSEDTFDDFVPSSPYEAGFVVNISGPVRAIRSHIGANSGTYTMSTDIFYPQREDSITDLRVHPVPSIEQFDDYATGVAGLKYSDDQNPAGVPVDGATDVLGGTAAPQWQMVSGAAGSLVMTRTLDTDVPGLTVGRYYLDQQPANPVPCTGDDTAWGQSGVVAGAEGALPCTDPTICASPNHLVGTRHRYFEPPNFKASDAGVFVGQTNKPLLTSVTG